MTLQFALHHRKTSTSALALDEDRKSRGRAQGGSCPPNVARPGEDLALPAVDRRMMLALLIALFVATYFVARLLRPKPPAAELPPPPAPPRTPMRVTRMDCRGFLRIGQSEEPLPASPLGHGEFPTSIWVSPQGEVFAVGKLYTGQPGPDEGVVWKRSAEGAWSFAHRLPHRSFHSIAGAPDGRIAVGTLGGVVLFDGQRWTTIDLPYPMVVRVWCEDDELRAQAFDGSLSYRIVDGRAEPLSLPKLPTDRDPYGFVRDGVEYRVFERSTEIDEVELSLEEETEIRAELRQVQAALDADRRALR